MVQNRLMGKEEEKFELKKEGEIRVRFAPAPTGYLHIGNARTALFNYLFAEKRQGRFVLRVEDTDRERYKKEYEEDLYRSLKWLGVKWHEGPRKGGRFGPYRQSERGGVYEEYLEKLLKEDKAYRCFCSEEELEAQRQYFKSIGQPPVYNGKCRDLTEKEIGDRLEKGESSVIRFKAPARKIVFRDLVQGEIEFDSGLIGDFSLARNLREPLYNFACVVDDHQMKATHVIRGEDHIPNTPKQILLYQAFGWEQPEFVHLPLILSRDKSKLSKRGGAVAVRDFRKKGYLPEALVNMLAFLGWNPGTEKEIYSLSGLVEDFSLDRVRKSGAVFNRERLDYLNGYYIRRQDRKKLTTLCFPYLEKAGLIRRKKDGRIINRKTGEKINTEWLRRVVGLYQERLKKLSEAPKLVRFFFEPEPDYESELLFWEDQTPEETRKALDKTMKILFNIEEESWDEEELKETLLEEAEGFGREIRGEEDKGYLLWPLRVALTGQKASAGPFEIGALLGKQETLKRVEGAKNKLTKQR